MALATATKVRRPGATARVDGPAEAAELGRLETAVARARRAPGAFPDPATLAREAVVPAAELPGLLGRHFHTTADRLLTGARVEAAGRRLLETEGSLADVASAVGFPSAAALDGAFARAAGMRPAAYRGLPGSASFELALPVRFPATAVLAFLGRDPASATDRVRGRSYAAGMWLGGRPVRLEIALERRRARVAIVPVPGERLADDAAPGAHREALRRLGLTADPEPFERHLGGVPGLASLVVPGRRGIGLPLPCDPFTCLLWAIVGQQVTLVFARRLFGRLVERAGCPVGAGLAAPPLAEELAGLRSEEVLGLQLSRSKADYLLGAAEAAAGGRLDLEALARGSATAAEAVLLAERGVGPWTAQYVLLRGMGFADCSPVGDAGLARAVARFFALDHRPGPAEVAARMAAFRPYRSFATFHLWQSLEDSA